MPDRGPPLHPKELPKKFWGQYNENSAMTVQKTYPPCTRTFGGDIFKSQNQDLLRDRGSGRKTFLGLN